MLTHSESQDYTTLSEGDDTWRWRRRSTTRQLRAKTAGIHHDSDVARFLKVDAAEGDTMNTSESTLQMTAARPAQRVVIVNGTPDVLELLESVLDGGRYDLMFAHAGHHAYSLIAKEQPHLVVLCTALDDLDGFQLLSMLKLDPQTRRIPVVTYTTDFDDEDDDTEEFVEDSIDDEPPQKPLTLN